MLNFISSCFYGASKNKNGREISDYDRYKPWKAEEFSGKIKYTLDNGEKFEVFREFSKKNPKVYNENLEDISNTFNIDKTKGNQFFVDQTGIDENLFFNTMTICQDEVTLDSSKQNTLIQKITNVVSTGTDNVSYKKTMEKLNKKLLEEVGTSRTSGRPMNVIEEEIKAIEADKDELELYKTKAQNMQEEKGTTQSKLKQISDVLNMIKEIKEYKQKEVLEEQRIGINTNKLNDYKEKLNTLEREYKQPSKSNKKYLNPIIALIICIGIIGGSVLLKNSIISASLGFILAILFIINYYNYNSYRKTLNSQKEEKIKYNKEKEFIQEAINQCNEEINLDREKIEDKRNSQKEYIISKYGNNNVANQYILEDIEEIDKILSQTQKEYNEIILRENTINIEKNSISNKLEDLAKQVERLEYLYEQQDSLKKLANSINLAQTGLEEAYTMMKNTVTPKFTNELTDIVKNITNSKYKKVKFNDEDGLTVELDNGEYINCSRLSLGTIDQMYLSLRIAILNEISKETMPILLDETFAYYDEERLSNILKYISNKYSDKQIIILTCTNREIEALNNLNVKYNLITM